MLVGACLIFGSCGKKQESVVVAYTIYEPMNYMENGKLVGFDTELAEAVFAKLGYTVLFKEIDWDKKYTELDSKNVDCLWNGFTANTADDDGKARSEKVDFSYNYMLNKQVIVTKAELASAIQSAADLKDKVGAAEKGSAGFTYMEENIPDCVTRDATSQLDALKELRMGTVDFAVLDEQLAKAYIGKGEYTGFAIAEALSSDAEYYAIGFRKGSELTAKVNAALEELAADGTIAKLAKKYGVENTAITDFADQKK